MALKTEKVYSPIKDDGIKNNLMNSEIWNKCEHPDDVKDMDTSGWYEYSFKFDGLTAVQCTNVKKM